jgi:hypothetical protein
MQGFFLRNFSYDAYTGKTDSMPACWPLPSCRAPNAGPRPSITISPASTISPKTIVWGRDEGLSKVLDTGGRYNPDSDSWTATSIISAPDARTLQTAVRTGSEMIIRTGGSVDGRFNIGGRYCAQSGVPTPTATPTPTPTPTAKATRTAITIPTSTPTSTGTVSPTPTTAVRPSPMQRLAPYTKSALKSHRRDRRVLAG